MPKYEILDLCTQIKDELPILVNIQLVCISVGKNSHIPLDCPGCELIDCITYLSTTMYVHQHNQANYF